MQQMPGHLQGTIQEELVLQQRMWRAQRIGWVIMIVLFLCALTRIVGEGLTSVVYKESPSPFTMFVDRVEGAP
ncbi:MAG: hypothetical protein KF747_04030 [Nitrospira sp.]|nr:hypothetical protein [Nitrospira sp.]